MIPSNARSPGPTKIDEATDNASPNIAAIQARRLPNRFDALTQNGIETSESQRAKKRKTIDGMAIRIAASKDGTILLVMPPEAEALVSQGMATAASNGRYSAVIDELERHGLSVIRATPLVVRGGIIGYYVEFDGDAWSGLGL